jgi:hypothetical protein
MDVLSIQMGWVTYKLIAISSQSMPTSVDSSVAQFHCDDRLTFGASPTRQPLESWGLGSLWWNHPSDVPAGVVLKPLILGGDAISRGHRNGGKLRRHVSEIYKNGGLDVEVG